MDSFQNEMTNTVMVIHGDCFSEEKNVSKRSRDQKAMQDVLELIGSRCSIYVGTSRMVKKSDGRNQLRVKSFEILWEVDGEDIEDDECADETLGFSEEVSVDSDFKAEVKGRHKAVFKKIAKAIIKNS